MADIDTAAGVAAYLNGQGFDPAVPLRQSVAGALDTNPDQEARLQAAARVVGVSPLAARAAPADVERAARLQAVDFAGMVQRYPTTARLLLEQDKARVAHDDINTLQAIERAVVGGLAYAMGADGKGGLPADIALGVRSLASSIPMFNAGAWGVLAAPFGVADQITQGLDNAAAALTGTPRRQIAGTWGPEQWLLQRSRVSQQAAKGWMGLPDDAGFVRTAVASGLQSAGQNLAALPFGMVSPATMLGMMGAGQGGQSYAKGREAGLQPVQSAAYGIEDAVAEVVTERFLGAAGLLDRIKAGSSAAKLFAYEVGKEVPGEIAATVWQNFNEWANVNPDKSVADWVREQPEAIGQTIIATLVGGTTQIGAVKGLERAAGITERRQQQAAQAEATAQALQAVTVLAEASKLRERDPASFASFAQELADQGVPALHVEAKALVQSGVDIPALAQAMPSVGQQLEQALQTGGDVVIPTGEYLAGGQFAQQLVEHVRTAPDAMSATEAKVFMQEHGAQLQAEVERATQLEALDASVAASRDAVRDRYVAELQAAGRTVDVARIEAPLLASFYAAQGARMGMTPEQMAERYPLQVQRKEASGAAVFPQGQNGGVPADTNAPGHTGDAQGADSGKSVTASDHPRYILDRHAVDPGSLVFRELDQNRMASVSDAFADTSDMPPIVTIRDGDTETILDGHNRAGVALDRGESLMAVSLTRAQYTALVASGFDDIEISYAALREHGEQDAADDLARQFPGAGVAERGINAWANFPDSDQTAPDSGGAFDQAARGQIAFGQDITLTPSVITLLKTADLSTFVHELGHYFLQVQVDMAARLDAQAREGASLTDGERQVVDDARTLLAWFGVKDTPELSALTQWLAMTPNQQREAHERFARGFEAYAFEGKAPSVELQGAFQRFRAWLVSVYKQLRALNVELTPEVRGVMDRMLATSEQIRLTEQGRSLLPLFDAPGQAGMTAEEWADYQALGQQATADATEELQGRALRDLQWLRNARGRVLKRLQREAEAQRREVRAEARVEVMREPVYRAWAFLTGKIGAEDKLAPAAKPAAGRALDVTRDSLLVAIAKLGGISRESARRDLSVADDQLTHKVPVFGASSVFRAEGGMSADNMLQALTEAGYMYHLDEHGRSDLRELDSLVSAELGGDPQFSMSFDYGAAAAEAAAREVANPEALQAGRLDLTALKGLGLPAEVVDRLQSLKMTARDGLSPEMVAGLFGFTSADEMARTLAAATPPGEAIAGLTDQRMLERYGDLATPQALERAADAAVANEARGRMIAAEAAALERATGPKEVAGTTAAGRSIVRSLMPRVAREWAQSMIGRLRVRDIRPGQYTAAEARAARNAAEASRKSDLQTAAAEKRNQLVQHYAAREAYAAQDEVAAGLRYLKRFDSDGVRKGLDVDYLDQIDALLERFDLRQVSNKAIDKRTALAAWVRSQEEQGLAPDIPEKLLNEAQRTSYKNLTLEEFRGLVDSVRQIAHLAKLKHTLLTARDRREFEAVRDEMADSIEQHAGKRTADTRTPTTNLGRVAQGLRRFWAAHIKVATWAHVLDGGREGPVWDYIIRPANEAGDREATMRAEATADLSAILAPVFKLGRMGGAGQFFPGIKRSLNREARIAIALNTGNEGNLQRLLDGEGWTMQQLLPVLQSLTAAEWRAVQAIWDRLDAYRPLIAAKERRVYGKEPAWVDASPFAIRTADGVDMQIRGGYYPVKYDPAASQRAEEHADAEAAKRQLQGAYTSATTRRSFTKSRAAAVKGRPLLYTLAGLYSGVNDVIHDLAWHEWLIDANRLLRSGRIDAAIREHYGPEAKQQFKTWVQDIAEGERGADAAIDMALGRLRQGVSAAGLGFNVMSAAMQPLGITQSIVRVGAPWVGRGVMRYLAGPRALAAEINGKSEFMANRSRTRFRELAELRNQVQDQHGVSEWAGRYAYWLMMKFQGIVDVPTWWGAYEKALAAGDDESRAAAVADQSVIDAQGGGQTKDLSAMERGGPAQKLFTVFYSFMNTALNIGIARTMTADTPAKRAKLAADYLLLYVAPAVLGMLLKDALTPGDAGDDDPEKLARRLRAQQIDYLMGLMVVVREFSEAAKTVTGANDKGRDYTGPAGVRMIADAGQAAKQIHQGEFDDALRKALVNLAGDLSGLPAAQLNRTITGARALADGETSNPAALVFGFQHP